VKNTHILAKSKGITHTKILKIILNKFSSATDINVFHVRHVRQLLSVTDDIITVVSRVVSLQDKRGGVHLHRHHTGNRYTIVHQGLQLQYQTDTTAATSFMFTVSQYHSFLPSFASLFIKYRCRGRRSCRRSEYL
jgi:hypothetical protein